MAVARPTQRRRKPAAAPAAPAAPARRPARKAAPAPVNRKADVTEYADKVATGYHKAFAKWIVTEVGYDPDTASSKRAAFLKGVSIATAARPAFNSSDAVEEYREKSGEAKRGPKPIAAAEKPAPVSRRRKPAPVVEDDDFEDDEEIEESEDVAEDDDDFDDEDTEDDVDEEDDEDFEEEEEKPAPKPRGRPRKAAAPAKKAAPAARRTKAAPAEDDDDFIF